MQEKDTVWSVRHRLLRTTAPQQTGSLTCEIEFTNRTPWQPLSPLHFPVRHRLLIQPPLYLAADFFLLSFVPQTFQRCLEMAMLPIQLCNQAALHSLDLTCGRPSALVLAPPPAGATTQPHCPATSPWLCCVWGFPFSVFKWNSLQGSKLDTRCDEHSVEVLAADVQFALLNPCNQISFLMNKSSYKQTHLFSINIGNFV